MFKYRGVHGKLMDAGLSRWVVYQIIPNDGILPREEDIPRKVTLWKAVPESLSISSEILHRASHTQTIGT